MRLPAWLGLGLVGCLLAGPFLGGESEEVPLPPFPVPPPSQAGGSGAPVPPQQASPLPPLPAHAGVHAQTCPFPKCLIYNGNCYCCLHKERTWGQAQVSGRGRPLPSLGLRKGRPSASLPLWGAAWAVRASVPRGVCT